MTKEEIVKAADKAVDEHRMILISNNQFSSKNFFKEATDHAILQYENIIKELTFLHRSFEVSDPNNNRLMISAVRKNQSIVLELKSRL